MSIVVTGATGHLGRLVIASLLERGVAPDQIVAGGRNQERLAELARLGVQTAVIDYDDPATIAAALEGAGRVLLISGLEPARVAQHTAVVDAAKAAGISLLVYTSAPNAAETSMLLAADHRATEDVITASGVPYVFLRNGWYLENYTAQLPAYLEHNAVLGSAGQGRVSAAPRADFAAAAAAVLTTDGHQNAIYELGGDTSFTLAELAGAVSRATGQTVVYNDLPEADFEAILTGAGVPAPMPALFADVDRAIRDDAALEVNSGHLSKLIGRPSPTVSLDQAITEALGAEH